MTILNARKKAVRQRAYKDLLHLARHVREYAVQAIAVLHALWTLLGVHGIPKDMPKGPRKRGRPKKPKLKPPPELKYAQVLKHRRKGRVVSISTKVIFGKEEEIKMLLEASPVSKSVNISFIERNNLTLRQHSRRLGRKTNGFSKEISKLEAQLYLVFIRKPHFFFFHVRREGFFHKIS
ncbi:MAG: hypothetical protein JRG73_08385 [Deltaproteobacteria bacterium]|nr:hypothetical protein [Deltaproteobacteria bacterium]MBW2306936.1 hypothetical protein [Deltaproteobacteria bacterium]